MLPQNFSVCFDDKKGNFPCISYEYTRMRLASSRHDNHYCCVCIYIPIHGSRRSDVGIDTATRLWAGRSGVRLSLVLNDQTGHGARLASNSMGTGVISHG
jgi:hypothetical protein